MRRLLVVGLALAAAGCGATAHPPAVPVARSVSHSHPIADPVAPEFALRDQDGHVVRLSRQRGKTVLLTFLYTECHDECPLIASTLAAAYRSLPAAMRADVVMLAVSVDPAHDTRAAARKFVAAHGLTGHLRYLLGSADELKPVWQGYNLQVDVRNPELVDHSAYVLLLDRTGTPRTSYDPHVGVHELVAGVRQVAAT